MGILVILEYLSSLLPVGLPPLSSISAPHLCPYVISFFSIRVKIVSFVTRILRATVFFWSLGIRSLSSGLRKQNSVTYCRGVGIFYLFFLPHVILFLNGE